MAGVAGLLTVEGHRRCRGTGRENEPVVGGAADPGLHLRGDRNHDPHTAASHRNIDGNLSAQAGPAYPGHRGFGPGGVRGVDVDAPGRPHRIDEQTQVRVGDAGGGGSRRQVRQIEPEERLEARYPTHIDRAGGSEVAHAAGRDVRVCNQWDGLCAQGRLE